MRSMILAGMATLLLVPAAAAQSISGDYLEARNANVWAGPCLVNSEIGLVGQKAVLAWKVSEGSVDGLQLDGLAVVAVVCGDRTFGVGDKVKTETVFVVDDRASESQQAALMKMATALAGETIQKVVAVKPAKIKLDIAQDDSGYAVLDAGIAKVRTRRMVASDNTCGVEERLAYPTLSKIQHERAAFTLTNEYSVKEFNTAFKLVNSRSGVIGKFAL